MKKRKNEFLQVACVSLLLTIFIQGFTLFEKFLITDDIAQHHIWLDAGSEIGLQSNDPWVIASKAIQPYLLVLIDRATNLLVPTLLVGKLIALICFCVTCILVYYIGKDTANNRVGWIALAIFCISDAWIGISGGFARTFAWPLVALFLLGSVRQNNIITGLSLFASAALYPIVFVLIFPAWSMILFHDFLVNEYKLKKLFPSREFFRRLRAPIIAIISGTLLILFKSQELSVHPFVGSQVSLAELQTNPLYGPEGRWPLWPQSNLWPSLTWSLMPWGKSILEPVMRHLTQHSSLDLLSGFSCIVGLLVSIVAIILTFKNNKRYGYILLSFAIGAITIFIFARLFLPKLYEPSRYLVWSMPLLAILSWAILIDFLLNIVNNTKYRIIGTLAICLLALSRYPSIRGKGAEDVSEYSILYDRLGRTAKGDLIASFPRTSDFIPVFSHRSIFVSHESSHAVIFSKYRDLVVSRQDLFVAAFYSDHAHSVKNMVEDSGVNWFVVEEKYYSQFIGPEVHFSPYKERINEALKVTSNPFLLQFARKYGEEIKGGIYLVAATKLHEKNYSLE